MKKKEKKWKENKDLKVNKYKTFLSLVVYVFFICLGKKGKTIFSS